MAAKRPTQKDLENWLCFMTEEEVDEALHSLSLKHTGARLERLARLDKWLRGEYSAADFEASAEVLEEETARKSRIEKRTEFLNNTCMERSGSTIFEGQYDRDWPHPASLLLEAPIEIQEKANKSDNETAKENTSETDFNITILERLTQQMMELTRRVDNLTSREEQSANATASQPTASSTRVDERRSIQDGTMLENTDVFQQADRSSAHVNFQDTFTTHYFRSSSPASSKTTMQEETNLTLPPPPLRTRVPNIREENAQERSVFTTNNTSTSGINTRDNSQVVKRWGITFSGDSSQSIDAFLRKVQDARAAVNMSETELLVSLAFLFTGDGELWYGCHKNRWRNWDDFCQAARKRWGSRHDLQERLRLEANQRFQQDDEPVRLYITRLEAMLLKLDPCPTERQQIELLFENMLPQLKRLVRKADCPTVDDLVDAAAAAEGTLEKEKRDRTPIPPNCSVMPEAAYRPTTPTKGTKPKMFPSVAAVNTEKNKDFKNKPPYQQSETTQVLKCLREVLLELQSRRNSEKPRVDWKYKQSSHPSPKRRTTYKKPSPPLSPKLSKKVKESKSPEVSGSPTRSPKREIKCFGCGKPNVYVRDCQKCQGNGKKSA